MLIYTRSVMIFHYTVIA